MADRDPHLPGHHPVVRRGDATPADDADDFGASAIHAAPPVGEEIHMPDPSLIPILNAAAVTVALLGVTSSKVLLVAGTILFIITTVIWVRDTRREIASLPAEHDHH